MTTRGKTRRRPALRVAVGREFEMSKPRFADTFCGQVLVLVIAALLAAGAIQAMERNGEPEEPPIQCILPDTEEENEAE